MIEGWDFIYVFQWCSTSKEWASFLEDEADDCSMTGVSSSCKLEITYVKNSWQSC